MRSGFDIMSKEFIIGVNRRVIVNECDNEYTIIMEEIDSDFENLQFHAQRWSHLVDLEYYIDRKLEQSNIEKVSSQTHLGGGFYTTIIPGFKSVDIRKYYFDQCKGIPCPSRKGIALKIVEWETLKHVFHEINQTFPELSLITPCNSGADRFNQEGGISCQECHPFRHEERLFFQ